MTINFQTHSVDDSMSHARYKMDYSLESCLTNFLSESAPISPAPVEGQMWIEKTTKRIFIYDGTNWQHVGNLTQRFGQLPLDGSEPMEADWSMGDNKIIGVRPGIITNLFDGVTKLQADNERLITEVGNYGGNGATQTISLKNASLNLVRLYVVKVSASGSDTYIKTTAMASNVSRGAGGLSKTDAITAFATGSFSLGANTETNAAATTFAYYGIGTV